MSKKSLHNLFLLHLPVLVMAVFASGCAGTYSNTPKGEPDDAALVGPLQRELATLGPGTEPREARLVAQTAVTYSRALAERYRVVPPALFHNLLIQVGIRERGLCYHWTEDLMGRLQSLQLKTYRLHWGVAFKGSDLREHNSVVITAMDQPFADGLVLDPWRDAGSLYWAAVKQDSYPWRELPRDQW